MIYIPNYFKKYCKQIALLVSINMSIQYGSAMLGRVWVVFRPLVQASFYGFIFSHVMKVNIAYYTSFVLFNSMLLFCINGILGMSLNSMISRAAMIKKSTFNKGTFVIADVLQNIIIYLSAMMVIFIIYAPMGQIQFHATMLLFPIYLLYIIIIMTMVSFSLSIMYVYFRDISYIIEIGTMIATWITPIYYTIEQLPSWLQILTHFNPFYILICPMTKIMFYGEIPSILMHTAMLGLFLAVAGVMLITNKKLATRMVFYL